MTRSRLLEPLTLRSGAVVGNRVAVAAMTNLQSHDDGSLGDEELRWLERRAAGGFGLIATCATFVSQDGKGWRGQLGAARDEHTAGLGRLASALARHGALAVVQLCHGGGRSTSLVTGSQPWSASAGDPPAAGGEAVRAATVADLGRVVDDFRAAALRAVRAGFAGVELHGAHGYLLCQFMSRSENRRTDGWGGDLVGRARLLREVTRAVRAVVPASFLVGMRISPEDFRSARGLDLDDSVTLAGWLADDGLDFLHVSLWDWRRTSLKRPGQHPLPPFRAALPADVALVAGGDVWTRDDGESLMDLGADIVALARAAILNPDWPERVAGAGASPHRPPMSPAELEARAVSPVFVDYLRRWDDFVA